MNEVWITYLQNSSSCQHIGSIIWEDYTELILPTPHSVDTILLFLEDTPLLYFSGWHCCFVGLGQLLGCSSSETLNSWGRVVIMGRCSRHKGSEVAVYQMIWLMRIRHWMTCFISIIENTVLVGLQPAVSHMHFLIFNTLLWLGLKMI